MSILKKDNSDKGQFWKVTILKMTNLKKRKSEGDNSEHETSEKGQFW